MKIGIIGDTHKNYNNIHRAMDNLMDCELILHTGDNFSDSIYIHKGTGIKIIAVKGNCDYENVEKEIVLHLMGHTIFLSHGHEYGVKYGIEEIKAQAKKNKADIVVFGHSHKNLNYYEDNILFINPGSIHLPRDGGDRGFYKLDLSEEAVKITRIRL